MIGIPVITREFEDEFKDAILDKTCNTQIGRVSIQTVL